MTRQSNLDPSKQNSFMVERHPCVTYSEINQRENNEDSYQVLTLMPGRNLSPLILLAIADGMGGHAHGEQVSYQALKKLSLVLFEQLVAAPAINSLNEQSIDTESLLQVIGDALEQVNTYVKNMVQVNQWGKAGSTLVLAVIQNNTAVIANLGDSPLFHFQLKDQQLTQITHNHTVAGILLQAGLINAEMARYHEGRSQLEFYAGCDHLPRELPICQLELLPGDLLLLCSDGISGSLLPEQIEHIIISHYQNLDEIAKNLVRAAQMEGETDNQTLILWQNHPSDSISVSRDVKLADTISEGLRFSS